MKRAILAVALAGTALVSLPLATRAQVAPAAKPVEFGIAAGAAIPTSDLSNATNTGFNLTGTLGYSPSTIPLGIRVDVAYNRFGIKKNSGLTGDFHFTSVTGNLVYSIPSETVSPYLIGGAGLYNSAVTLPGIGSGSSNDFGWNLGGGIKMPLSGFDAFVEARYNQTQTNGQSWKFIPITFGVMF